MGSSRKNPRYNVVSIRINEEERRYLDSLTERNRKNVSGIIREALELFMASSIHNSVH